LRRAPRRSLLCHATAPTDIYTLSLHDALPIYGGRVERRRQHDVGRVIQVPVPARRREGMVRVGKGTLDEEGRIARLARMLLQPGDRKSTRLNSSHVKISYAVFCLKKKKPSNNG